LAKTSVSSSAGDVTRAVYSVSVLLFWRLYRYTKREFAPLPFLRIFGAFSLFLTLLLFSTGVCYSESLWNPGFNGYAVDNGGYLPGSIILVRIQTATDLSLKSIQSRNDSTSMSISGGSVGDLLSFVPSGDAQSSREVEDEQRFSLETRFAVRVTGVEDNGNLVVRGRRQITVGGLLEEIYLEGVAPPGAVQNGVVDFSDLADGVLRYRGNAQATDKLIVQGDLSYAPSDALIPIPGPEEGLGEADGEPEEGAETDAGVAPEAAAEAEVAPEAEDEAAGEEVPPLPGTGEAGEKTLQLNDEIRDELIRLYLNRFLQILFDSPGADE
jgi:hypothetical protein